MNYFLFFALWFCFAVFFTFLLLDVLQKRGTGISLSLCTVSVILFCYLAGYNEIDAILFFNTFFSTMMVSFTLSMVVSLLSIMWENWKQEGKEAEIIIKTLEDWRKDGPLATTKKSN